MFAGKSLLRTSIVPASDPTPANKQLLDYLSKYSSGGEKKPKKRKKVKVAHGGVKIVDHDLSGFSANRTTGDEVDDDDTERPVVVNLDEADRLRRQVAKAELRKGWEEAEPDPLRAASSGNRGRQRHDSDDDASPPRRRHKNRHDSSDDASPPRRHAQPNRPLRHDSSDDASPLRRPASPARGIQGGSDSDASPPRRTAAATSGAGARIAPRNSSDRPEIQQAQVPQLMSDGTMSGLVSGKEIQEQMLRARTENLARVAKLDPKLSGRNAKSVFRDKTGKEVTEEELRAAREKDKKAQQWETPEWGAGIAQRRAAAEAAANMKAAASQPFAQSREAQDADVSFRERERWGDPMAHLVRKKAAEMPLQPLLGAEQRARTGFIIPQGIPAHSWLKRKVGAPPNRYNIRPGRHWDGVDRSNGFENEMFAVQNSLAAQEREAQAWGQEDM